MNGSLNVVTGFSLGIIYEHDDPDFIRLAHFVKDFFENMAFMYSMRVVTELTPMFMLEQSWYRNVRSFFNRHHLEDRYRYYIYQAISHPRGLARD